MVHNLVIVDDHNMYLEGILSILNTREKYNILLASNKGKDVLEFLKTGEQENVDLILSDISMPEINGISLTKQIKTTNPAIKVLIVSMHNDPYKTDALINLGVDGYIPKDATKTEFFHAIELVLKGEKYFSKEIENKYLESKKNNDLVKVKLTKRETEVIKLIAEEYTTQEIADQLFISKHTVESYRKNLILKLNVKNIAGLTKYALKMDVEP